MVNPLLVPLRPWQPLAIERMAASSIFANFDSVGIGKTIEALGAIESMPYFKALIIVEGSTIIQWRDEIAKFTGRDAFVVRSESKQRRELIYNRFDILNNNAYLITNYGKTRVDFDLISKIHYNVVLFDEGAILSNPNKTRDYCKWLCRKREKAFAMTAIPISNNIMQFYDFFDTLGFTPFDRNEFLNRFAEYQYERIRTRRGTITKINILGAKNLAELKQIYGPYYIRRQKKDIKEHLPVLPKNYYYRVFDMDETQQQLYNKAKDGYLTLYRNDTLTHKKLEAITAYTAIVQILDSPYLVDNRHTAISPKIQGLLNLIPELQKDQAVIYTKYIAYGKIVQQALQKQHYSAAFLHGEVASSTAESMKSAFRSGQIRFLIISDYAKRGQNLQNASSFIFMDLPYTPDSIFQLIGRIDRVGQEAPFLNIFFMLMNDTVEYNIFKLLKERQAIFDGVFDEDSSKVFNLTTQDFIKSL